MIFGGKRKMKERKLYPRPELVRENWTDLCGRWEFDFDFGASARERGVPAKAHLDREITVPLREHRVPLRCLILRRFTIRPRFL